MVAKAFSEWYQKNKDRLSALRKSRYHTDPVYREKAQKAAAERRTRLKVAQPEISGMTIDEVCSHLDISSWTLNKWRSLGYYPSPVKVSGRPVFTSEQVELLNLIKQFFVSYPRRSAGANKAKLDQLVEVVQHNWSA